MVSSYRKNSILNLIFNYSTIIFNLITGVFLVPLYLASIPLAAYGSFIVAVGIAGLIGLLEFGLSMVLTQRLAKSHAAEQREAFRQTTYSGLVAASLLTLLVCAITLFMAAYVPALAKASAAYAGDLTRAFILLGIAAGLSIFLNLFGSIFQALLRAQTLGTINIAAAAAGILAVVVVFSLAPSLTAIAVGTLVRVVCATLLLMYRAFVTLRSAALLPLAPAPGATTQLLKSCVPIFIGGVSKSLAENAQNLMLAGAASPAAVAILALTQKALQICSMILAPIGSSIFSTLTQIKQKIAAPEFSSLLAIAIRSQFLLSALLIATATYFNETFMSLWVGAGKFGGLELSVLLGIAMLITTRFSFFSFLIYSTGEFKQPVVLETSYSIVKCLILYATVERFGLYAIPLADIAAGFVFLYLLSTRLMAPHVMHSPFGQGIYYRGWGEFAAMSVAGFYCATLLRPYASWLTLGTGVVLFFLAMLAAVLGLNASFVKAARGYSSALKSAAAPARHVNSI
jgi:O-antigen/teichoic acid export membrane protein